MRRDGDADRSFRGGGSLIGVMLLGSVDFLPILWVAKGLFLAYFIYFSFLLRRL